MNWTKSPNQDFEEDNRGWPKGKRRNWAKATEEKVEEIYKELESDPEQFYVGATAIEQRWREKYLNISPPPLRTIGRILKDLGLSSKRKKGRNKGAARYLCYPEYSIYEALGGRVAEADFIGKKFIVGRTEPVNFISFCFKKEPKLRYFQRIEDQTANTIINECEKFFKKFEKPDFLKVDNCLATIGSASGKRNLSRTMLFLLKNQVIPIFSVPRKPFSQASIEGNNSVFSRKFWNREIFESIEHIDERLKAFNKCSQWYTGYKLPEKKHEPKHNFIPKVFFIRQVKEYNDKACINILNEEIFLKNAFVNYFVLAEWDLKTETLIIYFEKEQQQKIIHMQSFKINQRSKKGASLSFDQ